MGLAASQARLLLLTARKSDLEYRAQCITNTEMVLAMQTEEAARIYANKIGNTALFFNVSFGNQNGGALTAKDIGEIANGAYVLYINGQPWQYKDNFVNDKLHKKYIDVFSSLHKNADKLDVASGKKVIAYENQTDKTLVGFNSYWSETNSSYRDSGNYVPVVVENPGAQYDIDNNQLVAMLTTGQASIRDVKTGEKVSFVYSEDESAPSVELNLQEISSTNDNIASATDLLEAITANGYSFFVGSSQVVPGGVNKWTLIDPKNDAFTTTKEIGISTLFPIDNSILNKDLSLTSIEPKNYSALELIEMINNGTAQIRYKATGELVSLSGNTNFTESYYTDDDAEAEAEYKRKTAAIQVKEKRLQMELNQIEAQQKACDTEIDSVKKVMEKNIDRTFKVFS